MPEAERFAQHVRAVACEQEMRAERHRTYELPEEPLRPDVLAMERGIRLSQAIAACWRQ